MKRFRKYWPYLLDDDGGTPVPPWRQHLQPCEFLETDGDSYIQTNIMPNQLLETTIKIENFNSSKNWVLGSRISNTSRMYALFTPSSIGRFRCDYNNIPTSNTQFTISTSLQQLIVHFNYCDNTQKKVSILDFDGNVLQSKNLDDTGFAGAKEIPLFAGYATTSNLHLSLEGSRIYFTKFSDNTNNELLLNLIAAYVIDEYTDNKSNICGAGVPGMVDTLTGVFYTNDGGGQFVCGRDINI